MVTYCSRVDDADAVFKALADPTRRRLLDLLFERDGRTSGELEAGFEMTRFGVAKHLRLLTEAGLVTSVKTGRERHYFLNPVPIQQIHDRWIDKYRQHHAGALAALKTILEQPDERNHDPRRDRPGVPRTDQGDTATDLGGDHHP
jgi:DNA-binding transcriptional ArsR family regulator